MSSFVTQEMVNAFLEAAQPKWRESLSWFRHEKRTVAGLSALSATPLASRLALARALVPGWAVVPVEPTEAMCNAGADELPTPTCESTDEEAAAEIYRAMLTAAEEPPHGP